MKLFFSILTLVVFQYSIAQKATLKKPLTKNDLLELDQQVKECLGYEASANFTFNSRDFYDSKYFTGDTANNINQVAALEKQLKGNYRDAIVYNNIGMVYKGLLMPDKANENFNKALEQGLVYVKNNPDSPQVHNLLGAIYSSLGKLSDAIPAFKTAYQLDNRDSISRFMIPMSFVFAGSFDSATAALGRMFNKPADEFDYCCMLTLVNYWKLMSSIQQMQPAYMEIALRNKSADELMDLTRIADAYNRNKDKSWFELLYRFNRHLAVCLKSFMRTLADPQFSTKDIKFKTDEKDLAELNSIEKFYKKCLTDTAIPNKFILYKSLGNIYLLRGQTKAALPFLQTAIKLKPKEKSKFDYNAAEDYDNVAAAYFLIRDTLNFEKTVKEKIAVKPAINPLPIDYATMAKIAFFHKNYAEARSFSEQALKLDPTSGDAHICLAAIDILNRNIKEAYKKIDALYAVDPKNYAIYILQGICLLHDNDASSAYASFNMARDYTNDPKWIDEGILKRFFSVNQ